MNTGFHSQKIFRGEIGGRRPNLAKNLKLKMMNEGRQKASFKIAKPTRRSPSRPWEAVTPNQKVCPFLCSLNAGCKRASKHPTPEGPALVAPIRGLHREFRIQKSGAKRPGCRFTPTILFSLPEPKANTSF